MNTSTKTPSRKSFKLKQPLEMVTIKSGVESKPQYAIVDEVDKDGIVLKVVSTGDYIRLSVASKEIASLIKAVTE